MLRGTIIVKQYLKEGYSDLETVIMLRGYETFYPVNHLPLSERDDDVPR